MPVYVYSKVAVYAEQGGTLRLARNTRVQVTDTVTHAPVNVTQGAVVGPYIDTDSSGVADFTAEHPGPLRLTTGGTFVDVYSNELPGIALLAVAAAEAAQQAAEDAAAAAFGPTDATVATLVGTSSATRTALDARYVMDADTQPINRGGTGATTAPAALVALGGAPLSLTGTYAARPAATAVAAGTIYYATNVPEQYRSNGATWSVVGSGGNELGRTEVTAATFTTTSTTPVDVTGASVTFVAGERAVEVKLSAMIWNALAGGYARAVVLVGSTVVKNVGGQNVAPTLQEGSVTVTGLTPGTTYTAKVQLGAVSGGGTASIGSTTPGSQISLTVTTK